MYSELKFLDAFRSWCVGLDVEGVVSGRNGGVDCDGGGLALAILSLQFRVVVALVAWEWLR